MDVLQRAWAEVRKNQGSAGIDKVTIKEVEERGVTELLLEIQRELEEQRYRPLPVRRAFIPKPGKATEKRPLGIPAVKDRIVQAATKLVIEPVFEASFLDCSYGFRPKRSPHQAHAKVQSLVIDGYREVVDVNLKSYFETIPHRRLLTCVRKRVTDSRVLRLIRSFLKAGIMDEGKYQETKAGVKGVLNNWNVERRRRIPRRVSFLFCEVTHRDTLKEQPKEWGTLRRLGE